MGKWTVEKMSQELQMLLGDQLVSVVLFGSAAAGDHTGQHSDINLLVTTRPLRLESLQKLSKAVKPWVGQGNPAPLFLHDGHLDDLTDVFPVEILDMQHNHRVLVGPDPLPALKVDHEHLRVELEHELRGKLLQLKTKFILTEGRVRLVQKLMVDSLSTFLVLAKNILWLYGEKPPLKKMEAVRKLKDHAAFDLEVLETIERLKRGEKVRGLNVLETFEKYLGSIESIVDNVNR